MCVCVRVRVCVSVCTCVHVCLGQSRKVSDIIYVGRKACKSMLCAQHIYYIHKYEWLTRLILMPMHIYMYISLSIILVVTTV